MPSVESEGGDGGLTLLAEVAPGRSEKSDAVLGNVGQEAIVVHTGKHDCN